MTNLLFDKEDVLTVLNVDEAKEYIKTKGYFGNTLFELQAAVSNDFKQTLIKIDNDLHMPFTYKYGDDYKTINGQRSLFLPADKVKKIEKKLRPFTLDEFNQIFKIGHVITFRAKDSNYRGKWLYTGCSTVGELQLVISLYLGAHTFCL